MSPAQFVMAERRQKPKYREMGKSAILEAKCQLQRQERKKGELEMETKEVFKTGGPEGMDCFGKVIHFVLSNLLMLAHIAVPKSIIEYMKVNVLKFSRILHQLEIATVDMQASNRSFILPVEMSNLKQLEVVVKLKCDQPLLWLADLIQSAPGLQKFVLEFWRS
ncbi:hypothetical protein OROGR_006386 [Orobanche gracilis]